MRSKIFSCILFVIFFSLPVLAQGIFSLTQDSLSAAKTGEERFWVIYNTHISAIKEGRAIRYEGIDTIKIQIPMNAVTIPLPEQIDFGNAVIQVTNKTMDFTLFALDNSSEKYETSIDLLENKRVIEDEGAFLVLIEDETPWVENRSGYNYGHIRKDIIFTKDGKVNGTIVSSYGTSESRPKFQRSFVTTAPKRFKNLTVIRDSSSLCKTYILRIANQYNVNISNLTIITPDNDWYGDAAIRIDNSFKVRIDNTTIDGTYSQIDKYGYGISMNNVQDVVIIKLKTHSKWGIFGNNNVNNARLKYCDINRFDVHCYGRDVTFEKCVFRDLYNQFSSMYGTISFINCQFIDFTPVLFESSYNAYTKFDLIFKNCKVQAGYKRRYLISGGLLNGEKTNNRMELSLQEYPNLYIDGMKVYLPDGVDNYYIYMFKRRILQWPKDSIPGIKRIRRFELIPPKSLIESNVQNLIEVPEKYARHLVMIGCSGVLMMCIGLYYIKKRKCNRAERHILT